MEQSNFIGLTPNEKEVIDSVRQRHPDVKWGDAWLESVWVGERKDRLVLDEHEKAIRFKDYKGEQSILGYCTEEYQVIPYELTVHQLEQELAKLNVDAGFGPYNLKLKQVQGGRKFKAEVDFPECEYEIRPGKPISPRVNMYRSYDLGWEYGINFGALEKVCTNGLIAWKVKASIRKKHRRSLASQLLISDIMSGMEMFSEQVATWQKWAAIPLKSEEELNELVEALPFGAEHKREILSLPSADDHLTVFDYLDGGNLDAWRVHSMATQFLSHRIESEVVREDKTEKVARIFTQRFGNA